MTTNNAAGYSVQCVSCYWFIGFTGSENVCFAFPDGIPDEIFTGVFDHKNEYANDDGIRYREDPEYRKILNRILEEEATL